MSLSTAAKVGIITLLGLLLLASMIIWKTEIFMTSQGYEMIATFDSIEGLTLGSEVRFRGLKVGKVAEIDPGPYDIKVYSQIEKNLKIPADSTLRVSYDGIVGLKYLEIRPGTSESLYAAPQELIGQRTSAIVDFIDIGSQNLVETKAILESVRKLIENPAIQNSFKNAIFTFEKTSQQTEKLITELRAVTEGVANITTDPKFQENVKGTMKETEKTLSSANKFFDSIAKVNLRATGGVDVGTRANAVRGDVDIIQNDTTYYRFGIGEGPTRQLSVLDFLVTNHISDDFGVRLGIINNQLGGGVILSPAPKRFIVGDIYDLNNPRPSWPKVRLGYQFEFKEYMDVLLQADDILNSNRSNITLGIRVKPLGEKAY